MLCMSLAKDSMVEPGSPIMMSTESGSWFWRNSSASWLYFSVLMFLRRMAVSVSSSIDCSDTLPSARMPASAHDSMIGRRCFTVFLA